MLESRVLSHKPCIETGLVCLLLINELYQNPNIYIHTHTHTKDGRKEEHWDEWETNVYELFCWGRRKRQRTLPPSALDCRISALTPTSPFHDICRLEG